MLNINPMVENEKGQELLKAICETSELYDTPVPSRAFGVVAALAIFQYQVQFYEAMVEDKGEDKWNIAQGLHREYGDLIRALTHVSKYLQESDNVLPAINRITREQARKDYALWKEEVNNLYSYEY